VAEFKVGWQGLGLGAAGPVQGQRLVAGGGFAAREGRALYMSSSRLKTSVWLLK
jgi:hypothetical protein